MGTIINAIDNESIWNLLHILLVVTVECGFYFICSGYKQAGLRVGIPLRRVGFTIFPEESRGMISQFQDLSAELPIPCLVSQACPFGDMLERYRNIAMDSCMLNVDVFRYIKIKCY